MTALATALKAIAEAQKRTGERLRFDAHANSGNVEATAESAPESSQSIGVIGNKSADFPPSKGSGHPAVSVTKPCFECGSQIMAKRSGARYCSAKCKQAAYRTRMAA